MFALRKEGSISNPWLGSVPEIVPGLNFFSLDAFYRYPDAKQLMFHSIDEARVFIRDHPDVCGTETVICEANFTTDGVTFRQIPAECFLLQPTTDEEDDGIPF